MEAKKEEFRRYLEESGVIAALTKALIGLYEMKQNRPALPIAHIQNELGGGFPTKEEYDALVEKLNEQKQILADLKKGGMQMVANENEENPNDPTAPVPDATVSNALDPAAAVKGDVISESEAKKLLEELLNDNNCNSMVKHHVTIAMLDQYKDIKTDSGKTLIDCISSGLRNPDSSIGIYAADADSYEKFKDVFDPMIEKYHKIELKTNKQDKNGWVGDATYFEDLNKNKKNVLSTRIRCARSLEDYGLNSSMTENDYVESMEKVKEVLKNLGSDFEGVFHPLEGMAKDQQDEMIKNHQLFKSEDKYLKAAGAMNFWPKGRGIFINNTVDFMVWVNEEDHLRFISMNQDGDIEKVYNRLKEAVEKFSEELKFKWSDQLGWKTFCLTNLGSTIRASVMIKLHNLAGDPDRLKQLAEDNHLQLRGTDGNLYDDPQPHFKLNLFYFRSFR